jgi:hypothetical protein
MIYREARLLDRLLIPLHAEWSEDRIATQRQGLIHTLRAELPCIFRLRSARLEYRQSVRADGVFLVVYAIDSGQQDFGFLGKQSDTYQFEVKNALSEIANLPCETALALASVWTADHLRDDEAGAIRTIRKRNVKGSRTRSPHGNQAIWEVPAIPNTFPQAAVGMLCARVTAWFPRLWVELEDVELEGDIPQSLINVEFSKRFLMKVPGFDSEKKLYRTLLDVLNVTGHIHAKVAFVFNTTTGEPRFCELIELLGSGPYESPQLLI